MTKTKNWLKLIALILVSVVFILVLFKKNIIDVTKILELGEDFQYNAISTSSIIGGFLFTGIGILISTIDKERIRRLWEHNYLDNLYRAAFVGMGSNLVTIICAFALLCCEFPSKANEIIAKAEVFTLIEGIMFFAWCIKDLIFTISRLKNKQ